MILINRNKDHVDVLKNNRARITGTDELKVEDNAYNPDKLSGKYDIILLLTKQLFNTEVVTFLI